MVTASALAQLVNVNPDPNGSPWIAGGALLNPLEVDTLIPFMVLTPESAATELPESVDNSKLMFMPPVFDQEWSNACAQVAELWYTFGYEINRLRNVAAGDYENDLTNLYHPNYSYNFLNMGSSQTFTSLQSGFGLIKESGCPSYDDYFDPILVSNSPSKYLYWMHGYDNYFSGLDNKISDYEYISWDNHYDSLVKLKHWISDHNAGDTNGGLAIISVFLIGAVTDSTFPPGTPEEHQHYVSQWGTAANDGHALTIVGYHDDVHCFDIDGDGEYENEDFNGNGTIELDECEKGAFKVVNSWGDDWLEDGGYIYVPYKIMAEGLHLTDRAYICYVQDEYEPLITVKAVVEYPKRRELSFRVGYAEDANSTLEDWQRFKTFFYQGGQNNMRGAYLGPIETGLDFWTKYSDVDFGKIFFIVNKKWDTFYAGTVDYFSIVDYRWNEEFELPCTETDVEIVNNGVTVLSVDYDLIVPGDGQVITQDDTLYSNMVSRFSPTVTNNSTLTVENEVVIDMYNSELIIESGSSLVIDTNAIFRAKRGTSKIIINGNLSNVNGVNFIADAGSKLEIILNNENANIEFSDCEFENAVIECKAKSLSISNNCSFTNSMVNHADGNFTLTNSTLCNSTVKINNTTYQRAVTALATITGNTFSEGYPMENQVVGITNYSNFTFSNNTLVNRIVTIGTYYGLLVSNSGGTSINTHIINNNEIYSQAACMAPQCPALPIGLGLYNSYAKLEDNNIHHNYVGLECLNNTQVDITGNSEACEFDETQRFINNGLYQVYVSENGFPHPFEYNALFDDVYSSSCFILHDVNMNAIPPPPVVDVENNYWGTGFNPLVNLCPDDDHFDYIPIWTLCDKSGSTQDEAAELYAEGIQQIADSSYIEAKSTFLEVVTEYPETHLASSAMKELFFLEPLADNDFTALQNWYLTEDSVIYNEHLEKLGQNLANKCDEKLENFEEAIDWYEDMIEDPPTLQDSVFAIIDLEYCYLQMGIDTSLQKSSYVGRMPQYKPNSLKAHEVHRNELLALLLDRNNTGRVENEGSNNFESSVSAVLLQNNPNPFSNKTKISFCLNDADFSTVEIRIYNHIGKQVQHMDVSKTSLGLNTVELNMLDMHSGIYFYSLFVNGKQVDTRKMVVVK